MKGRAGRVLRLGLVPLLVLSAEVGVTAQRATATPPPVAAKPPATTAVKPATPATTPAKATTPPVSSTQLKSALDRIQQRVAATVGTAATPQIVPHFPGLAKGPTKSAAATTSAAAATATPAVTTPAAATAATAALTPATATSPAAAARPGGKWVAAPAHAMTGNPRIELSWRTSLAWPQTLVGAPAPGHATAPRITLIWK